MRANRKVRQELFHLPDVSGSRKKDQEATELFGLQQTVNGVCHLRGENFSLRFPDITGFDREHFSFAGNHGGLWQLF